MCSHLRVCNKERPQERFPLLIKIMLYASPWLHLFSLVRALVRTKCLRLAANTPPEGIFRWGAGGSTDSCQSALTGRGVKKEQEMIFKAFANCAGSVSSQQTVLRGTAICVIPASEDSVRWRHYLGRCEKKRDRTPIQCYSRPVYRY